MVLSYKHYLKTCGSNDTRAQDIDSYITAMPKRDGDAAEIDPTFRRYAPSPSAREATRQWIEVIGRGIKLSVGFMYRLLTGAQDGHTLPEMHI